MTSSNRYFERSGPSASPIAVEPAISAISTATTRRSPSVPAIHAVWHRPAAQPGGGSLPATPSTASIAAAARSSAASSP